MTLTLEVSGCHAVLTDGTCERPQRGPIRIWIDAPPPVVIRLDDKEVVTTPIAVDGGTRIALDVGSAARVDVLSHDRRATLRLVAPFVPSWAAEAAEARSHGDHSRARTLALPHVDDPDPAVRSRALGIVGRADLARGNAAEAIRSLTRSSHDAEAAGRVSDAVDDALAASFALAQRSGRWTEAGAAIDRIEPLLSKYADGRARAPYYRALVDSAFGDVRGAMQRLRLARTHAERLGLARLVWNVRNEWALSLERWGRRSEAVAELTSLVATTDPEIVACDRATASLNVGYSAMMRGRERKGPCIPVAAREGEGESAEHWLRSSLTLGEACPEAHRGAMAHILLGDVAWASGDIATAKRELELVGTNEGDYKLRRDAFDLRARIDLATGDARGALAKYERLASIARANGRFEDERSALQGQGDALEKLGNWEAALVKFAAADALLERASLLVPLGEASVYRGARETSVRSRIDLLLSHGRAREALDVAREARVRLLLGMTAIDRIPSLPAEARQRWSAAVERYRTERTALDTAGVRDWELATSELEKVQSDRAENLKRLRAALDDAMAILPKRDVELSPLASRVDAAVFATTLRNDAVVFVEGPNGLRSARITLGSDPGESIVRAASPEVERASTVRVVTSSDLACADVHAQRLSNGRRLASSARVIYGLDLPEAEAPRNRAKRALVVSDSRSDLPLARDEGTLLASSLQGSFDVVHLSGKNASTAVSSELSKAAVFHYAGHAVERDGDLVLPLAGSTELTTSDVLALPTSPERVTLSACQAGRVSPSGITMGLGFAQAFVERGAVEVLAPTRPVKDDLALALARALVASKTQDFAAALATLAETNPDSDWSAYRIWGR